MWQVGLFYLSHSLSVTKNLPAAKYTSTHRNTYAILLADAFNFSDDGNPKNL